MFGLAATAIIILIVGALLIIAFEIWMIVNAVTNKHIDDTARVLWVIGMLLIHPIIAIVYFFTDYQKTKLD